MPKVLRVLAKGSAMVPAYHQHPARRFVGRSPMLMDGRTGWAPSAEPTELPSQAEYLQALRDGDLWPADKATADEADIDFDSKFGGEYAPEAQPAASVADKKGSK